MALHRLHERRRGDELAHSPTPSAACCLVCHRASFRVQFWHVIWLRSRVVWRGTTEGRQYIGMGKERSIMKCTVGVAGVLTALSPGGPVPLRGQALRR